MANNKRQIPVSIDISLLTRIEEMAKVTHRSRSAMAEHLLKIAVDTWFAIIGGVAENGQAT
jgi:hypothetical protein